MNSRKLVKKVLPKAAFQKIAPYGHWAEAVIAQQKHHYPAQNLNVIGVTGTDGKTTTCNLIAEMLRSSGKKVAMITTAAVDYGDGKGQQPNPTSLTTGNVFQLMKMIKKANKHQAEWLVLEVSSHALNQRRVWGIPFSIAVHTNMSQEHLDYHGTFENYRKAKQRLFKLCNSNKNGMQTGIINADDRTALYFVKDIKNAVTYGIKKGGIRAQNIKATLTGNEFDAVVSGEAYHINIPLVGGFNVYNALAAVGVGRAAGLSKKQIETGLASLKSVPGRMMPIEAGQKFKVFIDYAVTPAAIENVLRTIKDVSPKSKVHIVFGATGDRDTTKRPLMGKVAAKLADFVYLTDDETYTEDPELIRQAVFEGVQPKDRAKVKIIDDRKAAIQTALNSAKAHDVVIITGIGHQTTRNMGGVKRKWSDIEITRELLKAQK